jgi:hypothetical protein
VQQKWPDPADHVLGHTIEEQARIKLNERGVWEPKLAVDGIENKLAATAFTADPATRGSWPGYAACVPPEVRHTALRRWPSR